ncbi:hypothetical protein WA026_023629 [Henosepilachna vigintioctopunctata]|uniref:Uncharacterized protein n=1 Tax=Henosepilachna vigintioctopunctata TaxID=420089 RepID=A0AAW1USE9_9CUCU
MISAGEMGSWEYVDGRCDWSFLDPKDDVETYQASSEDDLQLFSLSLLKSHECSETQIATVPAPPEEVRTHTEVHPKDVFMTKRPRHSRSSVGGENCVFQWRLRLPGKGSTDR